MRNTSSCITSFWHTFPFEDGYKYIQDYEGEFDVVIVDSTDPVGFAHVLTTEEFFRFVHRALREEGIFAAQTESIHYHLDMVSEEMHRYAFLPEGFYRKVIEGRFSY